MVQGSTTATVHNGLSPGSWDLITAAQGGDRDAFGELYARYAPQVSRFVGARVGGDRALAEDLTSETFLRALRSLGSVSDQGRDPGAWFTTIARNLVLDHVKSARHRRERVTGEIGDSPARDRGPEETVIRRRTAAEVECALTELPNPTQRECIRLRFLQERSVAETAEAMGRTPSAVKALTHRALQGLRTQLAGDAERVPVPRDTTDPMQEARHTVALAHQSVAATGRRADRDQAERVARSGAADRAGDTRCEDGRGVLTVAEGVA